MRLVGATIVFLAQATATALAGPSTAVLCLDKEFKLGAVHEVRIPKGTVFRNHGPITGDITTSWHVVDPAKSKNAAIITTQDIVLTKAKRCEEAPVKMFVDGVLNKESKAIAADHDHWGIGDIIDYVPGRNPEIEIGKLVDDIAVIAQLRTDVDDALNIDRSQGPTDEAAICSANAKSLAAQIGGALGRQTSSVAFIGHPAAQEMSLSCGGPKPSVFVSWDHHAKPTDPTLTLISQIGSLLKGASRDGIKTLTTKCITEALKPESDELASREYDGVRVECQSFTRDGGAGSVTIYRRFGPYPALAAPNASALRDLDRESEKMRAAEKKEAEGSREFAKWWLDDTVPKNVKSALMLIARMQALGERCPTWKPSAAKIASMAASAGIEAHDILPGGKYRETYALLATAMHQGAQDESAEEACEAARKYDK